MTTNTTNSKTRRTLMTIKRVWNDQGYYDGLCRKVEQEAVQHDIAHNTERFIKAVGPAVLSSKGLGPDGKPLTAPVEDKKPNVLKQALARKQAKQRSNVVRRSKRGR